MPFINPIINPLINSFNTYRTGGYVGQIKSKQNNVKKIIKLSSNENPYGMSKNAIKNTKNTLDSIERYPDDNALMLRRKLANFHGIKPEQIVVGCGSTEIIELIIRTFSSNNTNIIVPKYSFSIYKLFAKSFGIDIKEIDLKNWRIDVDDILNTIDNNTSLIIIANPGNPVGSFITASEAMRLIKNVSSNIIIMFDEAYFDYVTKEHYTSVVPIIAQYPNVISVQTFSKIYGLAALRVGYSLSSAMVSQYIKKFKKPFSVSTVGLNAACFALDDINHIIKCKKSNTVWKRYLEQELHKLDLPYLPNAANFITIDMNMDSTTIYKKLLKKWIMVKPLHEYGLSNYIRVSIGLKHENQVFISALKDCLRRT